MAGIPIILDTDIGVDVDDVWALAMMLRSPELDVRLITTATGDTVYAARIVARLLEIAGRTDIPIGIGIPLQGTSQPHADWVKDYPLENYPGTVHAATTETETGKCRFCKNYPSLKSGNHVRSIP